ncbi:MAG: class I cytochrome c [Acidobacteria bacterium]|nr:MAG: class I cytochrome c [Acidobacteriota bacterium]PYR22121.1 MAG: class I cytochrome c [Acidobacteriota bacterium]
MNNNGRRGTRGSRGKILISASSALIVVAVASLAGAQQQALGPPGDTAAVERGRAVLSEQCGFCHGANARGGSSGPDLTRSALVQEDENGKQLGEFLRVGRPDRGMPKFDLPDARVADVAAFLHAEIYLASNRRLYKILDVLVGDPKAGQAFFNGAGRCSACHSATGDLKGIGAKYDPVALQGRIVYPRRGGVPGSPAYEDKNAIKATITPSSGAAVTGAIVRLTDFEVTIYDAATRQMRSWLRNGDTPKVVVTDPLQAHMDQLMKWTDTDMHNTTSYLASLK